MYYITPGQYEIAENNGISEELLHWRVRDAAWEINRAITQKPRKQGQYPDWIYANLKKYGINRKTFHLFL